MICSCLDNSEIPARALFKAEAHRAYENMTDATTSLINAFKVNMEVFQETRRKIVLLGMEQELIQTSDSYRKEVARGAETLHPITLLSSSSKQQSR